MEELDGYDKLAALVRQHQGMAIFRQFSNLGAKNLLYRQAQLVHLDAQLRAIVQEDRSSNDPETAMYHCSVFELMDSVNEPGKSRQWKKALEMREQLEQYCE
jgi:hypothetical protein